ncbi:MAG: extracellular solute-binding protein [Lacrimispora celerecrescens]|nr:extracellular solute-binding protein [Lacrimispora celerecrescens]
MQMKGKSAICLAAVMLLSGCSGTGGSSQPGQTAAESAASETGYVTTYGEKTFDNVTITVELFDRSTAPAGSTITENRWTNYIKEEMNKVGINVEFVAVPRNEETTKIQTMMASGTAPDIIMTYDPTLAESYYVQGGTYDLSPYIDGDGQAKNLKAYVTDQVLDLGRNTEGGLWAIPARRSITARQNVFIRKDWLDKLGMEIPTTTDELYNVLKAFKNNNPDGRTDVVPFYSTYMKSDWTTWLSSAFMQTLGDEAAAGVSYKMSAYLDPGYKDYLQFMNKLYNEGLLDPEFYTSTDQDGTLKEKFVNGQLGIGEYSANGNVDALRGGLLQNLKALEPEADMVSIPPLKNVNDGKQYNPQYSLCGAYNIVPKTCKNPEAVVTYLDWLSTKEGGFAIFHGFEGEHYNLEDGVPVVINSDFNAEDKDWIRHDLFLVGNQGYYASEEDFMKATSKEIPGYEEYVMDNFENAIAGDLVYDPAYTSPTQSENSAKILLADDEYLVKCMTCAPEDFDKTFDAYMEALKEAGAEEVKTEREEYFRNK